MSLGGIREKLRVRGYRKVSLYRGRYFCTPRRLIATDKLGKAISGHGDHLCIDHND